MRSGEGGKFEAFDREVFGDRQLKQSEIDYAASLLADAVELDAQFQGIPPRRVTMTLRAQTDELHGNRKAAAVFTFQGDDVVHFLLATNSAILMLEGTDISHRADVKHLIRRALNIYDAWRKVVQNN